LAAAVSGVDELLGIRHTHHTDGTATAELTLLPECFDHYGGVASGVLMMLADIVLARTSLQVLPADRRIATSNLHVDLIASPMTALGSIVGGSARVDAIVDAGVRCRADLVDSRGELIAVASARFCHPRHGQPRCRTGGDGVPASSATARARVYRGCPDA
jgi:acyl-coenzyme A thioesterase PaaI-like protein